MNFIKFSKFLLILYYLFFYNLILIFTFAVRNIAQPVQGEKFHI